MGTINQYARFGGIINSINLKNEISAYYRTEGHNIILIPTNKETTNTINKAYDEKNQKIWLHGFTENGNSVAFLCGRKNSQISSPVNLNKMSVNSPIIIRSKYNSSEKIDSFDTIEFYGGVIDLLHMTSKVMDEQFTQGVFKIRDKDDFTRKFSINQDNENYEIEYSIDTAGLSMELGKIPDFRNNIHSVLRFCFKSKREISEISKFYTYAKQLIQFCVGRLNVAFEVHLVSNKSGERYFVDIEDEFNNMPTKINVMNIIGLDLLGDKLPNLFNLLSDKKEKPHLLFLPKRNEEFGYIKYTDVSDICVSLEKEYNLGDLKCNKIYAKQGKLLSKELIKYVEKSSYDDIVKEKACNIISGTLKNMQPSLKEKIMSLYEYFYKYLQPIAMDQFKVELGVVKSYKIKEFEEKVKEFIAIRNGVSHYGIQWNEGIKVYNHLWLLIYFSILNRAGYSLDESAHILSYPFSNKF